ncbi:MAG: response regulator transcription factor [Xanthobacteraceae bacterium]
MTDELFAVRVLFVSAAPGDQELFRRAASAARIPVEVTEADGVASAGSSLAAGIDVVFIDDALGDDAIAKLTTAARVAAEPPFTVLLSARDTLMPFQTDALANKPSGLQEAKSLVDKSIRVRLTSRVIVVDDSSTMRSIVRKILAATRFPLEVREAGQGSEALELARQIDFDLVFLDYNMPGFTGLETMGEIRREKQNPAFVLITSVQDEAVATRARALGAAFLKKPFYLADVEAIMCGYYGLRALNPQRA